MNTLYYGDNLKILREHIATESVDLIYLDPPFNSNRNYNVLFKNESGIEADSQIKAFDDTWHWNRAAELTYNELINEPDEVGRMIEAFRGFIVGQGNYGNQMMAYLVMMAVRLKELHRVLKSTGSLYLHCDPTASHYLKILLDTIFGAQNFRNEIIWQRTSAHANVIQKYGAIHDIVYFYSASDKFTWNQQYIPYTNEYIETFFDQVDDKGKRYARRDLTASMERASVGQIYTWRGITPPPSRCWAKTKENMDELFAKGRIHFPKKESGMPRLKLYPEDLPGVPVQDVWDIRPLHNLAQERLGYPTQKPVALLERIISASSNEGDVVLDPFCGCGTTIAAAQKLNRQWIGIDITHLSTGLMKLRLRDNFGLVPVGKKNPLPGTQAPSPASVRKDADELGKQSSTEMRDDITPEEPALQARAPALQSYRVIGEPEDLDGAKELAATDRYDFQWWILPLIGARALGAPQGEKKGKKGADSGIDGLMVFTDDNSGKAKKVIVSVKSGGVNVSQIRDLAHVVDREKAAIGVFLTLEEPTKPMKAEAVKTGFYHSDGWNKDYPRLQILTVEEILAGKTVDLPPNITTFKRAGKIEPESDDQGHLGFG